LGALELATYDFSTPGPTAGVWPTNALTVSATKGANTVLFDQNTQFTIGPGQTAGITTGAYQLYVEQKTAGSSQGGMYYMTARLPFVIPASSTNDQNGPDVVLGPVVSHANNQDNDVNLVFEHGYNPAGTVWRVHVLFANVTISNDQFDMRVRLKREVW
jgi:hypothetical protein